MKNMLFVNACVNRETSRTMKLAKAVLAELQKKETFKVTELILEKENIPALNSDTLNRRTALIQKGDFSSDTFGYAKQFSAADCIVIASPFWDMGFSTHLKAYVEAVSVTGIVAKYAPDGRPIGLCRAGRLYYVTTRGGFIDDTADLGYQAIKRLADYFGIKQTTCVGAGEMDIPNGTADSKLQKVMNALPALIK